MNLSNTGHIHTEPAVFNHTVKSFSVGSEEAVCSYTVHDDREHPARPEIKATAV